MWRFALPHSKAFCGGRIGFLSLPDPGWCCLHAGPRICGRSSSALTQPPPFSAAAFTGKELRVLRARLGTEDIWRKPRNSPCAYSKRRQHPRQHPAIPRTKPGLEVTDARAPTGPHLASTGASQPVESGTAHPSAGKSHFFHSCFTKEPHDPTKIPAPRDSCHRMSHRFPDSNSLTSAIFRHLIYLPQPRLRA